MPERLSLTTVAICAVLAVGVFGCAYALAHEGSAEPAPAPSTPTTIRLEDDPIGELRGVDQLPALIVPPPRPKEPEPEPEPVAEEPLPVVPVPEPEVSTPAPVAEPAPQPDPEPTPAPTPKPPAPAREPLTFDDSG